MIEIHELTKRYGDKTALNQLTLTIASRQIFGLLGHNGAGKSTTIKNLVSIIKPTSGTVTVDGLDLEQQRQAVKEKISYVPDTPDIFLQLSAMEYWDLIAAAYQQSEKTFSNGANSWWHCSIWLNTLRNPWPVIHTGCGKKPF